MAQRETEDRYTQLALFPDMVQLGIQECKRGKEQAERRWATRHEEGERQLVGGSGCRGSVGELLLCRPQVGSPCVPASFGEAKRLQS